jgi:hypothetical protein
VLATRTLAAFAAAVIAVVAAMVMGSVHHSGSAHGHVAGSSTAGSSVAVAASVVGVGPAANAVTLSFDQRNVRYAMCSGSVRPPVEVGEFATASVDGGCLTGLSVTPMPGCNRSVEVGSYATGSWVGVNPAAHSVLYETSGLSRVTLAGRWCTPPTVRAADGTPVTLASIPAGATVRVVTSVGGWVTGVIVQRPARSGPAG